MMRVLKTAVIGLGRVGWQFHIPNILRHDGFALAAVVDPLAERREEARQVWGPQGAPGLRTEAALPAYPGYRALLDARARGELDLDLVVIASPTPFHAEQALAAFEQGLDVFCDKPIAPTLAQADQMIAAANARGRKLMVYQPHRAGVEVVALREILRRDLIGPLTMIKRGISRYVRRDDWQAFSQYGGGMLNNYGAHYIDQLLYLSGSRARKVSCALRTVSSLGDAEDVVKAVIETESGVILDVDIHMAAAHPFSPWQILGQRGSIVLDQENFRWRVRYFREGELPEMAVQEGLAARGRRYPSNQPIPWQEAAFSIADCEPVDFYERCYAFYALGEPPFVPIAETREVMRVLDACRQSAAS
jgi:scyllo-inositol 2-dehydrogenase (NADP+)